MRPHLREIKDWLEEHGAAGVRVEQGGKHPRVIFRFEGQERFYVTAGTPGDRSCGLDNTRSDLRHMLGLVPAIKRVGRRRTRRHRAAPQVIRPETITITPGRDWTAPLQQHPLMPEVLHLRLDVAWRQLWRDCMASVGGESLL